MGKWLRFVAALLIIGILPKCAEIVPLLERTGGYCYRITRRNTAGGIGAFRNKEAVVTVRKEVRF
jgi:hypothetical protein